MTAAPGTQEFKQQFLKDVICGLEKTQKELPSKYLYDAVGSRLFDVITELPEYGLTRAEERILQRHSTDIVARFPQNAAIAELGSGSGRKTRHILQALRNRSPRPQTSTIYYPIEISRTALEGCEQALSDIEGVRVVSLERDYLDGVSEIAARRGSGEHIVVLFLGSTIGNFERKAAICFLSRIRRMLMPGDALLLATDLMKPVGTLIDAYDDPLGVTAAFNLNLLARINRELNANFDLAQFRHVACFNERARAIEMRLASRVRQTLTVGQHSFTFEAEETIWTESCHKYSPQEPFDMASESGFRCTAQWIDEEWKFAENLFLSID
jgi:L-histidine Nalpha-methyltransferase